MLSQHSTMPPTEQVQCSGNLCCSVPLASTSTCWPVVVRNKEVTELERRCREEIARAAQEVAVARERADSSTAGRAALEHRRALDVAGWAADVTLLRKSVGAVDRYPNHPAMCTPAYCCDGDNQGSIEPF